MAAAIENLIRRERDQSKVVVLIEEELAKNLNVARV
jgi:hypothetical protein